MFDKTFILITGLHKSGTTLFNHILGTHQSIDIMRDTDVPKNEGQYVQSLFPIGHLGGPGRFGFRKESYRTEQD